MLCGVALNKSLLNMRQFRPVIRISFSTKFKWTWCKFRNKQKLPKRFTEKKYIPDKYCANCEIPNQNETTIFCPLVETERWIPSADHYCPTHHQPMAVRIRGPFWMMWRIVLRSRVFCWRMRLKPFHRIREARSQPQYALEIRGKLHFFCFFFVRIFLVKFQLVCDKKM